MPKLYQWGSWSKTQEESGGTEWKRMQYWCQWLSLFVLSQVKLLWNDGILLWSFLNYNTPPGGGIRRYTEIYGGTGLKKLY